MQKPVLIIVNGLPASGKTTLANRLGHDLSLPVLSRDGIYETLYDALEGGTQELPPLIGSAAFRLLYHVAGTLLSARQSLIIEGFFGRPDLRSAEFADLQRRHDFTPFQILCKTDGATFLTRLLARAGSPDRHPAHNDLGWLEQNKDRLLRGELEPLALKNGQVVEINTTTPSSLGYNALLRHIRSALNPPDEST